jgi:hypothetical protein
LDGFQGVWSGGSKKRKNPLFHATFGGILGFSEEENNHQMENIEKLVYSTFCILIEENNFGLVNFFQKCTIWEITSLAKNSSMEKGVKNGKFFISILLQFFYQRIKLKI